MSVVNVDVGGLASAVIGGLDSLFTSDEERADATLKVEALLQQPHILQAMANIEAAKNTNWFVAGGRPALLWICGVALLYNWILKDFITIGIVLFNEKAVQIVPMLPSIDGSEVTGLILALLGLGAMRTYEKTKGVARD